MHGMKVNDSQYIHSTTLTLDISKVHTWACGETVVLFWYNHHNLQYQQNSSSAFRFFFYRLSVLLSILVSSSSFSPSHTPALYPSFLFPRLSRCHSALCLFHVSLCALRSVKQLCNPELRRSRPARRWNFPFSDGLLSVVQVPLHPFVTLCFWFWCLIRCAEFKYRPNCFSHHHLNLVFDQIGKKTLQLITPNSWIWNNIHLWER